MKGNKQGFLCKCAELTWYSEGSSYDYINGSPTYRKHNKTTVPRCVDSRINWPEQRAWLSRCVVAAQHTSHQLPLSVGVDFNCIEANIRLMENSCRGGLTDRVQVQDRCLVRGTPDINVRSSHWRVQWDLVGSFCNTLYVTWEKKIEGRQRKASHKQLLSTIFPQKLCSLFSSFF